MDRNKLSRKEVVINFGRAFLFWLFGLVGAYAQTGSFATSSEKPYDVITTYIGMPPGSQTLLLLTFDRKVYFPASFAGSTGSVGANPTSTAALTIYKNGSSIGSVSISTSGVFTFTLSALTTFVSGDVLSAVYQTGTDATLNNLSMTLAGTRQGA